MKLLLALISIFLSFGSNICNSPWWENAVIYEIYPQSFFDSNNDGFGDLPGIQAKLRYLTSLGIDALYMNPIYKSPLRDGGYDITNHKSVHPLFGTMEDFQSLSDALKTNGIKLILDFVPNHTSKEHEWFQKSIKREGVYTHYYVWMDPKGWDNGKPIPPNNWESRFSSGNTGSAWSWNDERQQFYYHSFHSEQPDLNLRYKNVVDELKDVLKFWVEKGARGFRIDAACHLIEDPEFRDDPSPTVPTYTQNLPQTHELVHDFRSFLDDLSKKVGEPIGLFVECYAGPEKTFEYYGVEGKPEAHFPFNYLLLTDLNAETDAYSFNNTLMGYFSRLKKGQTPNWVSGNHDWPRIPSRMGSSSGTSFVNMLAFFLPGTTCTFMGDEIGMDNFWNLDLSQVSSLQAHDYRTSERTPFQWSNKRNAGFSENSKPWLPVHPNFYRYNVKSEMESRDMTDLDIFKLSMKLKRRSELQNASFESRVINKHVIALIRKTNNIIYVGIFNMGKVFVGPINPVKELPILKNAYLAEVVLRSLNLQSVCKTISSCWYTITNDQMHMSPKSGMILKFEHDQTSLGSSHTDDCDFFC